ncbi:hypothetical protein ACFRIC_09110 [Streptomyces sp. NPDC056738]|uniref:hypothetical protein n=1 Tax=Streptomyces sp. NPDC056738 TaxID=3345933 RepID=UPI0036896999
MLTIEVRRHRKGESYFEPWIEEHDNGCTFHFHWDDISDEGCDAFSTAYNLQVLRWRPRLPGSPLGPRIPVTVERRAVMDRREALLVHDRADRVAYAVRADLISARAAESIARAQSERSPYWERVPARVLAGLRVG